MDSLQRGGKLADYISEWLMWVEESYGEEFAYISSDLVDDLARYLVLKEES